MKNTRPPQAELFIATGCAYCPLVMNILSNFIKQGLLSSLSIYNIATDTSRADELGIRSVPWLRINEMVAEGNTPEKELRQLLDWSNQGEKGLQSYYSQLLTNGELHLAESVIQRYPHQLGQLLPLLGEEETPIQIRLGIDALVESVRHTDVLTSLLPQLIELATNSPVHARIDALHYLALSGHEEASAILQSALDDPHPEVRTAAAEAMEEFEH